MTPKAWDVRTPLCGYDDPKGREDTANSYTKTVWQAFRVGHNADGTHRTTKSGVTLLKIFSGSYSGDGTLSRTITLSGAGQVQWVQIIAENQAWPAVRSTGMTGTKPYNDQALISDQILSLNSGSFTVQNGIYVNSSGVDYYYFALAE